MLDWLILVPIGFILMVLLFTKRLEVPIKIVLAGLLMIPIINALADTTTNLVGLGDISIGFLRALVILPVFIWFSAGQFNRNLASLSIFFFLAYLFFVLWFSSDSAVSSSSYLKILISLLAFPVAIRFVRTVDAFKYLAIGTIIGMIIIIVAITLSQIFQLGISEYAEATVFLGGAVVQVSYTLVLGIILAPTFVKLFNKRNQSILILLVTFFAFVLVILIARRISYLALAVGLATYTLLSKNRSRTILVIVGLIMMLIATWPLVLPIVGPRLDNRWEHLFTEDIFSTEARLIETSVVLETLREEPITHKLFGNEALNSTGFFLKNSAKFPQFQYRSINAARQLHVDYNIFLHGTGLIGLLLYLLVYAVIIWTFVRLDKTYAQRSIPFEVNALFWALIAVSVIISLSGSVDALGYRTLLFLYLGSLIGLCDSSRVLDRGLQWS